MCQLHLTLALLFRDEIPPLFKWKLLWDPHKPCKQKMQVALIARSLLQPRLTSAAFLLEVYVSVFIFATAFIWKIMFVCYQDAHISFNIHVWKNWLCVLTGGNEIQGRELQICVFPVEIMSWGSISSLDDNLFCISWTLYMIMHMCVFYYVLPFLLV